MSRRIEAGLDRLHFLRVAENAASALHAQATMRVIYTGAMARRRA
jgi:hypothetical protein